MAELSHWKDIVVPQRHILTGCIPTGYEWMIRYLGIEGVDLETFQEDFDLELRSEGSNSFRPIAEKIKEKYNHIDIETKGFQDGKKKIEAIKHLIQDDIPCLISMAKPYGGYHIAPVVYADDTKIKVVWEVDKAGNNQVVEFSTANIVQLHTQRQGGKDIAWIEPSHVS